MKRVTPILYYVCVIIGFFSFESSGKDAMCCPWHRVIPACLFRISTIGAEERNIYHIYTKGLSQSTSLCSGYTYHLEDKQ